MTHNQEMLEKNNWGDSVKIVALSVDEDLENLKEKITKKGWSKIQHLTFGKWDNEHSLIQDFQISGIPFVCLVDKNGLINFIGHPSSINL